MQGFRASNFALKREPVIVVVACLMLVIVAVVGVLGRLGAIFQAELGHPVVIPADFLRDNLDADHCTSILLLFCFHLLSI